MLSYSLILARSLGAQGGSATAIRALRGSSPADLLGPKSHGLTRIDDRANTASFC